MPIMISAKNGKVHSHNHAKQSSQSQNNDAKQKKQQMEPGSKVLIAVSFLWLYIKKICLKILRYLPLLFHILIMFWR